MSSTTTEGQAQSGFGKLESVAGDTLGAHDMQAHGDADQVKGKAKEVEGKAKEAVGSAQQALGDVADKVREAASGVTEQARQTYSAAADKAQELKGKVEPMVQEKPYVALLAAFALGFLASRLIAPGGPRVIYVKPRD